jgi:hypothetical protein
MIYPNPTNGISLSGRINLKSNEEYSIVIFDKLGNVLSRFSSAQPEFTVCFPHTLSSGIYYARLYSATFSKTTCFLVKH